VQTAQPLSNSIRSSRNFILAVIHDNNRKESIIYKYSKVENQLIYQTNNLTLTGQFVDVMGSIYRIITLEWKQMC
jgi:hypothetical protein